MITIYTHVSIDSAHKLNLPYASKCNELHGHRWEIDLELVGDIDPKTGMVVDFTAIKDFFKEYDHKDLSELFSFNTTAENMAVQWAHKLKEKFCLQAVGIRIAETPNNVVEYEVSD